MRIKYSLVFTLIALIMFTFMAPGCETISPRERHFGMGEIYLRDGRYDVAELEFREVLAILPNCSEAEYNLGLIAQNQGDLEKALILYGFAVEHYKAKEKASKNELEKLKKNEDAKIEPMVSFTLEDRKNLAKAYVQIASIYWVQKNFTGAEASLKLALEYNEKEHLIYYNLGNAKLVQDKLKDSEAEFKHSLEIKPDYANAHIELAFLYEETGRIDKAKEHHSLARRLGKDDNYLVDKLDWWSNWKKFETKEEPKIRFNYPSEWVASSGKVRVGRVMVVFDDTVAVCYGEGEGTIQIIGPDKNYSYFRRGQENPYSYAKVGLLDFLKTRSEFPTEFIKSVEDQEKASEEEETSPDEDTTPDETTKPDEEKKDKVNWIIDLKNVDSYTYHNGIVGATVQVKVLYSTGEEYSITFWFYLGRESSYMVVGTYEVKKGKEFVDRNNRVKHALAYIAKHFEEQPLKKSR